MLQSVYNPPPDASHPHAQRPGEGGLPVDLSAMVQPPQHPSGLGIEPQLGSLSMQLGGYGVPAQPTYSHFPPTQAWPASYPFTIAQTTAMVGQPPGGPASQSHDPASVPPSTSHQSSHRTQGERGEDSPMVGVCVQQSPVASH